MKYSPTYSFAANRPFEVPCSPLSVGSLANCVLWGHFCFSRKAFQSSTKVTSLDQQATLSTCALSEEEDKTRKSVWWLFRSHLRSERQQQQKEKYFETVYDWTETAQILAKKSDFAANTDLQNFVNFSNGWSIIINLYIFNYIWLFLNILCRNDIETFSHDYCLNLWWISVELELFWPLCVAPFI